MNDLMTYAYGVNVKQIVNGPAWFSKDRFDVDGVPSMEALPTRDQFRVMVRKLLAERFLLVFHDGQKELSVYAITVAKGGPKINEGAFDCEEHDRRGDCTHYATNDHRQTGHR